VRLPHNTISYRKPDWKSQKLRGEEEKQGKKPTRASK